MNDPQRIGEALSSALATGPSRASLAAQRAQVIEAMQDSVRPKLGRRLLASAMACGAVALAAVAWVQFAGGQLQARFRGEEVKEQAHLVASAPGAEALDFSDGSQLVLGRQAQVSVSRLSRNQAQIEIERGRVAARIQKGTGRSWAIDAGPYSVRVVGTEFTVDWNREQSELAVNVTEGSVLVVGGDLPAQGVALTAGKRLVRRAQPAAPAPQARTEAEAPTPTEAAPAPELTARPSLVAEPSWRSFAGSAKYNQALQAAEREGFDQLVVQLPEKELLLLANTARYAGSVPRARQALQALRSRFAGKASAPVAALLLAGLAEDHAKNPAEAATWLRLFLKESPQGELSAGARARLLGILVRQGKQAEARSVASDYLRYHPSGPYADKARAVLGTASSSP